MTFTGWRLEAVRTDGWGSRSLVADNSTPRPFSQLTHTATCTRNPTHTPPVAGCSCGFYAVPSLEAIADLYRPSRQVWGQALAVVRVELDDTLPAPLICGDPFGTRRGRLLTVIGPVLTNPDVADELRAHLAPEIEVEGINLDRRLNPNRGWQLAAGGLAFPIPFTH